VADREASRGAGALAPDLIPGRLAQPLTSQGERGVGRAKRKAAARAARA